MIFTGWRVVNGPVTSRVPILCCGLKIRFLRVRYRLASKAIRRRADVVGISSNRASTRSLVGPELAEQHDEWQKPGATSLSPTISIPRQHRQATSWRRQTKQHEQGPHLSHHLADFILPEPRWPPAPCKSAIPSLAAGPPGSPNRRQLSWTPSARCDTPCDRCRRVYQRRPAILMYGNCSPRCNTEWWAPSLAPLESRKARLRQQVDQLPGASKDTDDVRAQVKDETSPDERQSPHSHAPRPPTVGRLAYERHQQDDRQMAAGHGEPPEA